MLIAIVSDSHSNYASIRRALEHLREAKPERVLHCGDISDPHAVDLFREFKTTFVFGNTDDDLDALRQSIQETGNKCGERFAELQLGGRKIAMVHGDDLRVQRSAEQSGNYDVVCYGHTHVAEQRRAGRTMVINPGALHRAAVRSIALLELDDLQCRIVPIDSK